MMKRETIFNISLLTKQSSQEMSSSLTLHYFRLKTAHIPI